MKYTAKTKEQKALEIKKYSEDLAAGIDRVRTMDGYKKMMDAISIFPQYSFNNLIMIFLQKPDATRVAGFNAWKKMGRFVKKGEKALKIWAPIIARDEEDDDEKPTVKGFRLVPVFDVSQTDGAPFESAVPIFRILNRNGEDPMKADVENFADIIEAIKSATAFPVTYGSIADDAAGICDYKARRITLREGMSELEQIKTLVHEAAHSRLHGPGCGKDQGTRELEAESVAYIVCRHFSLDVSAASFSYAALWSESMDADEIAEKITQLQKHAASIIDAVEKALPPTIKDAMKDAEEAA